MDRTSATASRRCSERRQDVAISVPKPGGITFEVVGPLPRRFYVSSREPETRRGTPGQPAAHVRAATLVTNVGVHSGPRVVARVTTNDAGAGGRRRRHGATAASTYFDSRTDALRHPAGAEGPPERESPPSRNGGEPEGVPRDARTSDDFAYAFSNWAKAFAGASTCRPATERSYLAHAVLDRLLVRGGETVSMKLLRADRGGFACAVARRLENR
jgi:hypothetical protein